MFALRSENYQAEFLTIADKILNQATLCCNEVKAQICEIEFYYTNPKHPDPFSHQTEDQLTHACWYFHRQNGGNYSGGSFKGLDITLGCGKLENTYGGILIRTIKVDNKIIEGPCKVVDWILTTCNVTSIKELVSDKLSPLPIDDGILRLTFDTPRRHNIIESSPRFGLTLKKADNLEDRLKYLMKEYRFTTCANSLKKGKNLIMLARYLKTNDDKFILPRWLTFFNQGKNKNIEYFLDKENCGIKTVQIQCEAYGFLYTRYKV